MCVSEGIFVSQYVFSNDWNLLKICVSEICIKQIRVNQGVPKFLTQEDNPEWYLIDGPKHTIWNRLDQHDENPA